MAGRIGVCLLLAATLNFASACRELSPAASPPHTMQSGRSMVRTELFFGTARSDGTEVSDSDWQHFVQDEITPRFPDGLTILEGRGQWRDGSGIQRERSRIVIILHDASADAEEKIEQVRRVYKTRFGQQSVLRTDSRQRVSF
jgi:hypothetical protein